MVLFIKLKFNEIFIEKILLNIQSCMVFMNIIDIHNRYKNTVGKVAHVDQIFVKQGSS